MKISLVLGLAAAATTSSADAARTRPQWMIGRWAWVSPSEGLRRGGCPESELYRASGYLISDELSRWWIEGDYLVRVTVKPAEGDLFTRLRHADRQRFRRVRPGWLIFSRGANVQWLIRCEDVRSH